MDDEPLSHESETIEVDFIFGDVTQTRVATRCWLSYQVDDRADNLEGVFVFRDSLEHDFVEFYNPQDGSVDLYPKSRIIRIHVYQQGGAPRDMYTDKPFCSRCESTEVERNEDDEMISKTPEGFIPIRCLACGTDSVVESSKFEVKQ